MKIFRSAFLVFLLCGCGYSFGSMIPADIRTVRLDVAERWPLAARGLEFELTGALAGELRTRYGLRVTRAGDARIDVNITRYRARASSSLLGKVEDATLDIEVAVKVTKSGAETEKVMFDGKLTQREPYSVSRGETEETARARAVRRLAAKIADCLVVW